MCYMSTYGVKPAKILFQNCKLQSSRTRFIYHIYLKATKSKRYMTYTYTTQEYLISYVLGSSYSSNFQQNIDQAQSIGSPMTTVSFDHGTFDHGHLTTGQ